MAGINTQQVAYACMGIGILGALGAFLGGGGIGGIIGAVIAALGAASGIMFYKFGYGSWPMITQRGNIVQIMEGGYEIPPTTTWCSRTWAASTMPPSTSACGYTSPRPKSHGEENIVYSEYFERAISSVKYVTKFAHNGLHEGHLRARQQD